jgi:hypothetical protein
LCSRKYLHTYLYKYLRECKCSPTCRQLLVGTYLCSRTYLHKYLYLCALMPPRDKRGPPAILPSRPWPLYLGFAMLTSRAWFSSSRSCEPEFGTRSAVRVVNERTRGVAKSLWQVLADKYLPTSNCGQVPALAQVLAHVLVQVFARAQVLADKHLCSRKYLHTYLHKYLRERKYLPTRVCGQVLVLAQVLAQVLPQVLVRPDAAARSILPSSANRSRIQHRVQRAASAARAARAAWAARTACAA